MPPVASAPALQCVMTASPPVSSVAACSPIARHMRRSSAWMRSASSASASASCPAVPPSASSRARSLRTAHARLTAVGRARSIVWAQSANRVRSSSSDAPSAAACRASAARPTAAVIPISGAPRTRRLTIASTKSSSVDSSFSSNTPGSRV